MGAAHVHLLLNHVPVLGVVFAGAVLLAGLLRGSRDLVSAGLWGHAVVALLSVPAYLSGERAQAAVRGLAGVSTLVMADHEAAALPAFLCVLALGVLAVLGLVVGRGGRPMPVWLPWAIVVGSVLAFLLVARAASLGGRIHHPELS